MQHIGVIGHDDLADAFLNKLKAAGFEVSGFALKTSRSKARMKGIAQVVSTADLVITVLESPQEIEEVYLGSGGILASIRPGTYIIDLTLNTPRFARELYALASVHDCYFIEAPFAVDDGEADSATAGAIRLFVGGEPLAIEQVRPILEAISPCVLPVGLPGAGASAKLVTVISQTGALMSLVEMLTFALNSNIDIKSIPALLASDPHVTPMMKHWAALILDEQFVSGSPIEPFFNELSIALDAADELDLAFPVLETAHQLYDLLMMVGGSTKALQALALVYREEEYCIGQGLDWALAQRAMDVYEQANGLGYDMYDDDCDDPECDHHDHHHDSSLHGSSTHGSSTHGSSAHGSHDFPDNEDEDDDLPHLGGYFSSN
ncbi:MAG: NAD(P)-binding domain-containing protein [Coriobacteriia bacterium]|nr:NAD(P)-binding domain-containing protein [Coriobacteriia bacterium]